MKTYHRLLAIALASTSIISASFAENGLNSHLHSYENERVTDEITNLYEQAKAQENANQKIDIIAHYLENNNEGGFRISIYRDLISYCWKEGAFSKALTLSEVAWIEFKPLFEEASFKKKSVIIEFALRASDLYARTGEKEKLKNTLAEIKELAPQTKHISWLTKNEKALYSMENFPEEAYKCGPLALDTLCKVYEEKPLKGELCEIVQKIESPEKGFNLSELESLARQLDLACEAIVLTENQEIPVPSVVHWKLDHYAVLAKNENGKILMIDPTFDREIWMEESVIRSEASGNYLVSLETATNKGYQVLDPSEASQIFGKGQPNGVVEDDQQKCETGCQGMPVASIDPFFASLSINDMPIWTESPRTGTFGLDISYYQESRRNSILDLLDQDSFTKLGESGLWSCNWLMVAKKRDANILQVIFGDGSSKLVPFLNLNNALDDGGNTKVRVRIGGVTSNVLLSSIITGNKLTATNVRHIGGNRSVDQNKHNQSIAVELPDGGFKVFLDRLTYTFDRIGRPIEQEVYFLSEIESADIDETLYEISYKYSTGGIIDKVTEASDNELEFNYNIGSNHLKNVRMDYVNTNGITSKKTATIQYNNDGFLSSITDTELLTSQFNYGGEGTKSITDIREMITPYGTTTISRFDVDTDKIKAGNGIKITDPEGHDQLLVMAMKAEDLEGTDLDTDSRNVVEIEEPNNISVASGRLSNGDGSAPRYGVTLHWPKKVMKYNPPNLDTGENIEYASQTRWGTVHTTDSILYPLPTSTRAPFEHRVYYKYDGQERYSRAHQFGPGVSSQVTHVVQTEIDANNNKNTIIEETQYNEEGRITKKIDPLGRTTVFEYDENGIDLLEVSQLLEDDPNGDRAVLAEYSNYENHQPREIRVAGSSKETITYNSWNQVRRRTSEGDIINYGYDSDGYIDSYSVNRGGQNSQYNIETKNGLVTKITDLVNDNEVTTYEYDKLDRLVKITYPDGTTNENTYNRLDLATSKDRLGRVSQYVYNDIRKLSRISKPDGRSLLLKYCACGSLQDLYDEKGNRTHWSTDLQGRLIEKTFSDGRKFSYKYDELGRVIESTNGRNQSLFYEYAIDSSLVSTTSSEANTPATTYLYDAYLPRLVASTTATGTTSYDYYNFDSRPSVDSGSLKEVDGPFANDTEEYSYDNKGRVSSKKINNDNNTLIHEETYTYQTYNLINQATNPLATFSYAFEQNPSSVRVPRLSWIKNNQNSLETNFTYSGTNDNRRLKSIINKTNSGKVSEERYAYRADEIITKIERYLDGSAQDKGYEYEYDATDRLRSAVSQSTTGTSYNYYFDKGNNIILSQKKQGQTLLGSSSHLVNNMNQLLEATVENGPMLIKGTASKQARITTEGKTTWTENDGSFSLLLPEKEAGENLIIKATSLDGANTEVEHEYEVLEGNTSTALTYDNDGNTLSKTDTNGVVTNYTWDAKSRLVSVSGSNYTTEFEYNAYHQRIIRIEKNAQGQITESWQMGWCGNQICWERETISGKEIYYFAQGEYHKQAGNSDKYYYTYDHLGSVREVLDENEQLKARYEYSPYGERTRIGGVGNFTTNVGFTGHWHHESSDMVLTWYRGYDPELGRWLSPDPIQENGGINLYAYVQNNPINYWDPLGLDLKCMDQKSKDAIEDIRKNSPIGRKNIEQLEKSKNTHYVRNVSNNGRAIYKPAPASNGTGTGSYIEFNSKGQSGYSSTSVVAHEIQHAADIDVGNLVVTDNNGNGYMDAEDRGVDAGNDYRKGVGENLRDDYGDLNPDPTKRTKPKPGDPCKVKKGS